MTPDGAGRAEFEAWVMGCTSDRRNVERDPEDGHYAYRMIQAQWVAWQAARSRPAPPAAEPVDEGELWSLIRRVLGQGHAQQMDYQAGKYDVMGGYEAFSANVDHAARERVPQFLALLHPAAPAPAGQGKEWSHHCPVRKTAWYTPDDVCIHCGAKRPTGAGPSR